MGSTTVKLLTGWRAQLHKAGEVPTHQLKKPLSQVVRPAIADDAATREKVKTTIMA